MQRQDKQYLFDLQRSKLNLLLAFLLNHNENLLRATTTSPNVDEGELTLGKIACKNRDPKLLELLLNLNSEVFKEQLGEIQNRESLAT